MLDNGINPIHGIIFFLIKIVQIILKIDSDKWIIRGYSVKS